MLLGTDTAGAPPRAGWRRADPGRPDDVPGLTMPPDGVCGRPTRRLTSKRVQHSTREQHGTACGSGHECHAAAAVTEVGACQMLWYVLLCYVLVL